MNKDCGGRFPLAGDITGSKAEMVHSGQDLTLGVKRTEVAVFETVFARSRV